MEAYEAILKRRSIRQFEQEKIDRDILVKIADAGRLAPSAMNMQPLKFLVIDDKRRKNIFKTLSWAGYLKEWTPAEDKQPAAYIFILVDSEIKKSEYEYDVGLAAENMLIAATGFGLGSCPLMVFNKKIADILKIKERYLLTLVVALGYPAEESEAEGMEGSIKYHRDENGVLYVPKRKEEQSVYFNSL